MPSLGTISGLGVGSKLDLQGTLDKLRQVDNAAVTALQAKATKAKAQLVAFDDVNAKFVAVKTHALSLSLESNFLTKKISGTSDSADIPHRDSGSGAFLSVKPCIPLAQELE